MNEEIKGIRKLKIGALLLTLAGIIPLAGTLTNLSIFLGVLAESNRSVSEFDHKFIKVEPIVIDIAIGMMVSSAILGLISIIIFRSGFLTLKKIDSRLGIGSIGAYLIFASIITYFISSSSQMIYYSYDSIIFLSSVFMFITGGIIIIIGFYRVGEKYGENLVSLGSILSIIFPLIGIAYLLVYLGLRGIEKKLRREENKVTKVV
ncbi:DUF973 family protein [Sulfurisphaera ohwakuensis]|uniref:DUF973 family protein n=1 Tax=Sulfurisphaera ohwakuensis TaxID=69656 RepID=A0A650CDY6_SULOH|nr:DUF973 family protein [Sulfurisphaera ohwakuensis]MBB5255234.1 hypothetical protein [Sulfurisphaera ohwakuensis]QGR15777.1 DUF973 family protein [Sulfurisphaera ohwakuensis]